MREMWQQDVLRYLTNRRLKKDSDDPGFQYGLHIPLKLVRLELGLGSDNARLSNFVNRNKNGAYMCGFDAADVVHKLVTPMIERGEIDKNQELRNFHGFLKAEGVRDKWLDIADYEQCLIAAFSEALPRRYPTADDEAHSSGLHGQRLQPSPYFTGRDSELAALGNALDEHGAAVMSGMGGIGKTVLAEEYARRNAGRYTSCQIVTAEPRFASYKDLVRAVRFDGASDDLKAGSEAVQTCMDRLCALDSSSLLILDNIDEDLEDYGLLRRLLRDSGAHIIITTRMRDAFPEVVPVPIDALPHEDQLRLLENSMGRKLRAEETDAASEICRRIDGHTLVIQLLGRAIHTQDVSCVEMLDRLEGLTGFAALDASVRVHKDDFNKTIRIQNFISQMLFTLEPLDNAMRDILRYLTLLPLEGMPRHILTAEPFTLDEKRLDRLVDRGWVIYSSEDNMLRLHPVVREVILSELTIDSKTCTPFLAMLSTALWEPKVSLSLPHLLRLASNIVDMLYISDPLRELLLSDRLSPLYEKAYSALNGESFWGSLRNELEALAEDNEILPQSADTLHMYVLFCELMEILDNVRIQTGEKVAHAPYIDIYQVFETTLNSDTELVTSVAEEFITMFLQQHSDELDDKDLEAMLDNPQLLLQFSTTMVGAELTDYVSEAGIGDEFADDPRALVSVFSVLTPAQRTLLESVSEPVFGSFLVTVLDALAVSQSVTPFVASRAVVSLTLLFILLRKSSEQIESFDEAESIRGWRFPRITYLPKGFKPAVFTYTEELWGRPTATQISKHGNTQLIVSMRRIDSDSNINEFEVLGAHEVEHSETLTILARGPQGSALPDLQAKIGQWLVRIASPNRLSQREMLKVARGLQLPEDSAELAHA